jgi:hypothetical protein
MEICSPITSLISETLHYPSHSPPLLFPLKIQSIGGAKTNDALFLCNVLGPAHGNPDCHNAVKAVCNAHWELISERFRREEAQARNGELVTWPGLVSKNDGKLGST